MARRACSPATLIPDLPHDRSMNILSRDCSALKALFVSNVGGVFCRGGAGGAAARTLSNLDRTTISHNFDDGELGPFYQCALLPLFLLYTCSRPPSFCEDMPVGAHPPRPLLVLPRTILYGKQ